VFHTSILGGLEICLVYAKPPVATELVAKRHLFQKLYSKPRQIHQNESNTFSKLFLLKWLFYECKCWYTIEQRGLLQNLTAYRLALIHSTCSSKLQSEL